MQQMTYQSNISNSRHLHTLPSKTNANRQTDPLDAIAEHIKDNPQTFANRPIHININNIQNTYVEQHPKISHKDRGRTPYKKQ